MPLLDELRRLVRADPRDDKAIAREAGVHHTTFSAFMAGRRGLSIDSAERLAVALRRRVAIVRPRRTKPPRR